MSRLKSIKDKMTSKEKQTVVLSEGGTKKEKVLWEGEKSKDVVSAPPKPKENKLIKAVKGGVRDAGDFVKQGTVHAVKGVSKGTQKAVGTYSKAYESGAKRYKKAPEAFLGFVGGVKVKGTRGKKGKGGVKATKMPGMATKKEKAYMQRVAGQTRSTSPQWGFDTNKGSSNYSLGGFGGDSYANAFGTEPAYSPRYPRPTNSYSVDSQYSGAFGSLQGRGREKSYQGAFGSLQGSNEPRFSGAFGSGMQGNREPKFSGAFGNGMKGKGKKDPFSGAFGGF